MTEDRTYPIWVKDEIDKIICDLTLDKDGLTRKSLKCEIHEKLIKNIANTDLDDKFDYLISKGYIDVGEKLNHFKVLKAKG